MVSDPIKGVTPYELFQELKSISDEANQLFQRLSTLTKLEGEAAKQLIAMALDPSTPVQLSGLTSIEGVTYAYEFDPENGFILQFTKLSDVVKQPEALTSVQFNK